MVVPGVLRRTPGYPHPGRVAERASMLDLVSGGRVELGTGETSSAAELGGFGIDRAGKRATLLETYRNGGHSGANGGAGRSDT